MCEGVDSGVGAGWSEGEMRAVLRTSETGICRLHANIPPNICFSSPDPWASLCRLRLNLQKYLPGCWPANGQLPLNTLLVQSAPEWACGEQVTLEEEVGQGNQISYHLGCPERLVDRRLPGNEISQPGFHPSLTSSVNQCILS